MSTQPYIVEFYRNGSADCWETFESPTPFQAINTGDVIQPVGWHGSENPVTVVRVKRVEHVLWRKKDADRVHHKLMIYVEEFQQRGENE